MAYRTPSIPNYAAHLLIEIIDEDLSTDVASRGMVVENMDDTAYVIFPMLEQTILDSINDMFQCGFPELSMYAE